MKPIKSSLNADLDTATGAATDAEFNDVNDKAIALTVHVPTMVVDAPQGAEGHLADNGLPVPHRGAADV